jgi:hypothetical protein
MNWDKWSSKPSRDKRNFPRICGPTPAPPYSKGIWVYFPRIKQLRYETASYHDPTRLWNPSCIIILKYALCLTKYYGLLSQEFYLPFRERMQDPIKTVRCSNFLHILTFLNMPAFYKTQSSYLIELLSHFKLLSCPALGSEGCHFMRTMCTED